MTATDWVKVGSAIIFRRGTFENNKKYATIFLHRQKKKEKYNSGPANQRLLRRIK